MWGDFYYYYFRFLFLVFLFFFFFCSAVRLEFQFHFYCNCFLLWKIYSILLYAGREQCCWFDVLFLKKIFFLLIIKKTSFIYKVIKNEFLTSIFSFFFLQHFQQYSKKNRKLIINFSLIVLPICVFLSSGSVETFSRDFNYDKKYF